MNSGKCFLVVLAVAGACFAQERELERVKNESDRIRKGPPIVEIAPTPRPASLHTAVRDWIESLLPNSKENLSSQAPFFLARLRADLQRNGLSLPPDSDLSNPNEFKAGSVDDLNVRVPTEDPTKLAITVGIGVPCGSSDTVYVYDYSQGSPRRILESAGSREHDESVWGDVRFSKADASGNQSILILRQAVQCASFWGVLSYDLFRVTPIFPNAKRVFGGEQSWWYWAANNPVQVRLGPTDLLMEIAGRGLDGGLDVRPHILHVDTSGEAVRRLDPVALKPQDFVDDWLTGPWGEMESRSAPDESLKRWHDFLHGDFVLGKFQLVQRCEKREFWQIGLELGWAGGKQLPEPLSPFFLVEDLGNYSYRMANISFTRQPGCPGDAQADLSNPSLF
jgi:hypothetical protein